MSRISVIGSLSFPSACSALSVYQRQILFLILFLISKIISLGSIAGAVLYGPYTFIATFLLDRLVYGDNLPSIAYVVISTAAALIIGIFVTIKHKDNIGRLIRGEEKKIKAKK